MIAIPFKIEVDGITDSCFELFIRFTFIKITDLSRSLLENSVNTQSSLLCYTINSSLKIERLASFHMSNTKSLSYSREDGRTRNILFNVCRNSCASMDLDLLLHCLSGKHLSLRAWMILVPGFHFDHVDHRQPILHLVALQRYWIFQAILGMTFFHWA